jgi:hypothetical protein
MATQTSTALELEALPIQPQSQPLNDGKDASSTSTDSDSVLHASRLADTAVPEGGYGWVVVLGCAILAWWMIGTPYSWGVMQGALVDEGLSSPAVLSFVGSLAASLISTMAIVNSRLLRLLGARRTGVLGISLVGLAGIFSGFAVKNIGALFATSGVLMGLGIRWVLTFHHPSVQIQWKI